MKPQYAKDTDVPVERSRAEIESTLLRYGADQFMYGINRDRAMIAFRAQGRHIKFLLPLPDRQAREYTHRRVNQHESTAVPVAPEEAHRKWEQACRQRWRALNLCIKAKLEAVAAGITTFEDEFMAHIVLPDGATVAEHVRPSIEQAYTTGKMPPLLPHFPS